MNKKYVVKEHPKKKVGNVRVQDESLPIGYNIVAGKMSFEVINIEMRKKDLQFIVYVRL